MNRINLIHPSELCDKYLSKMLYNDYTPTDAEGRLRRWWAYNLAVAASNIENLGG